MGWVSVGLLAYKSTENRHDSSFCSIIYSTGGSCSYNFHFSLCLAFPSSGNGRSTMTQAFKNMNLWRNLAQNAIAPIPLKAKQLLPAVVHFYLDELLRGNRKLSIWKPVIKTFRWSDLASLACWIARLHINKHIDV